MSFGRITNLMVSQQVLANINSSQNAIAQTEEELSTGRRINQPSDDPYGASLAVQLNGQLARLGDYTNNPNDGTAWTTAGLNAMSSISQQLQTVQELVVEASNGNESAADLQTIGQEVSQLTQGIKSDANTQYDGQYIFSGSQTSTPPYTTSDDSFHGATDNVTRDVGANASIAVNAQLYQVLNGPANDNTGLLSQLQTITTQLQSGTAPSGAALTGLGTSLSALEREQTTLGAAQSRLALAGTRLAGLQTSTTSALSDDEDANMASTLTTFSNEQAAFTAALKAGASIVQSSLMDFLGTSTGG